MFARTGFGIALVLATASASVAAPKHHTPAASAASVQNVYNPSGASVTDPDATVRFNLKRDWSHGRY